MKGIKALPVEELNWRYQETLKGMQTLPVEGLKLICWINGGAAISVLTYVGNLVTRVPTAISPPMKLPSASELQPAIIWYCAGLAAAAFGMLISYVVQLTYWRYLDAQSLSETEIQKRYSVHVILICFGGALAFFGIMSFFLGSLRAVTALTQVP